MSNETLFTSESVSEGHPDKMADQISDAILDALLKEDIHSRVACETLVKTGMVVLAGEITTNGWVDTEAVVRKVVCDIGYDSAEVGFDGQTCAVISAIGKQSSDIAMGVDESAEHEQGAGDQGMMFGYASNETDVLMPAPITYSHRLVERQAQLRKSGSLPWLRPDAKSQVTVAYDGNTPKQVTTVVISTQHDPEIEQNQIQKDIEKYVIFPIIPAKMLDSKTKIIVNPTGRFVKGGPHADAGLTGRKIIVDTYGGKGSHGGGAFSGKDPSKVDRSASYMARYIAKNIVASGVVDECEVQLAYAIGVEKPVSVMVDTFGKDADMKLEKIARELFDLTPAGIIKTLDLLKPIYQKTATYGHFGRSEFSWEKTEMKDKIKKYFQEMK